MINLNGVAICFEATFPVRVDQLMGNVNYVGLLLLED